MILETGIILLALVAIWMYEGEKLPFQKEEHKKCKQSKKS